MAAQSSIFVRNYIYETNVFSELFVLTAQKFCYKIMGRSPWPGPTARNDSRLPSEVEHDDD